MDDEPKVVASARKARSEFWIFRALVDLAVEKVWDDPDVGSYGELTTCVGFQTFGYRRHTVGLVNTEGGSLRIRWITADEGYVGAVQCRDHAWHLGARAVGQDLSGQTFLARIACPGLPGQISLAKIFLSRFLLTDNWPPTSGYL